MGLAEYPQGRQPATPPSGQKTGAAADCLLYHLWLVQACPFLQGVGLEGPGIWGAGVHLWVGGVPQV